MHSRTSARTSLEPRFQLGLNLGAAGLPGGIRTMLHIAWLSENPKVRAVAVQWNALSADDKRNVILEDLCDAAGVTDEEFAATVARTGFELGIDVGGMMAGIMQTAEAIECLAQKAKTPGGIEALKQFLEAERVFRPRCLTDGVTDGRITSQPQKPDSHITGALGALAISACPAVDDQRAHRAAVGGR